MVWEQGEREEERRRRERLLTNKTHSFYIQKRNQIVTFSLQKERENKCLPVFVCGGSGIKYHTYIFFLEKSRDQVLNLKCVLGF